MESRVTLKSFRFLLVALILFGLSKSAFGGDNTHVTNGFGKTVKVIVTHPRGQNDQLNIAPSETRNVPTEGGTVTISVFDPEDVGAFPYESINLASDQSVIIKANYDGKPAIRKVRHGTLWQEL